MKMKSLLTENTIQTMNLLIFLWPGQRSRFKDSLRAGWYGDQILVGAKFSGSVQIGPGAYPAPYTMGTGSFPGESDRGVAMTTHPHLAPRLRKE
jgi:hypothetical protein